MADEPVTPGPVTDDDYGIVPAKRSEIGIPVDVFVKGGTTTLAWDEEHKRLHAQSEALRAHQDLQYQAIADAGRNGGAVAGMFSRQLLHAGNPKVVIEYCYRDSALNQECLGELFTYAREDAPGETGLGLALVCPRCLVRLGRMDSAQVMIRDHIREFYLRPSTDPDFPEDKRVWVNPHDGQVHRIAGLVTTRDAIPCTALGCTWKFRIDDSKLREV